MTGKKTKYAPEAYGYIAPISIILIVFVGISVVLSIVLSFSKYNILLPPEFNGLENYQRLFSDTKFLTALTNTLKLLVYIVPLQTVLALLISALIASRRHTFLGKLTNIVIFIPVLSSNAVVGTIWKAILNGQVGGRKIFCSFWYRLRYAFGRRRQCASYGCHGICVESAGLLFGSVYVSVDQYSGQLL